MEINVELIHSVAIPATTKRIELPLYLATSPREDGNKTGDKKERSYYYGIAGTEWGALEDMALRFSLDLSGVRINRIGYK